MGHGYRLRIESLPLLLEPTITKGTSRHLDRLLMDSCIASRVKIDLQERDAQRIRKLTSKRFVTIRLSPSQVEIAMQRPARITQAHQYPQEGHGIRPSAQPHQYQSLAGQQSMPLDKPFYLRLKHSFFLTLKTKNSDPLAGVGTLSSNL